MAKDKKKSKRESDSGKRGAASQVDAAVETPETVSENGHAAVAVPAELGDHTDRLIESWQQERPGVDVSSTAVIDRLNRLVAVLRPEIDQLHERYGLTNPSFAVLATLKHSGPPYQLTQRALMDALQLTSGTISVRIDRLENDGLVERRPDPTDQRGVLVRLTPRGTRLFEQVAPLHLANEDRLLSALSHDEREQLASLLRTLLLSFEKQTLDDPQHPANWIGADLAPAHVARYLRKSAGLNDAPGLLVQSIDPEGPAAQAGLEEGDLIIAADRVKIRSFSALHDQLRTHQGAKLPIDVLRGARERYLSLPVPNIGSGSTGHDEDVAVE